MQQKSQPVVSSSLFFWTSSCHFSYTVRAFSSLIVLLTSPSAQMWTHVLRWPFPSSSKAFKTFSWEVKYKGGDPAGYTFNVISVLHTTERHGAEHARQLMAGTLSFRRLVSPESVHLMKPAKQWIQCEMWRAVGHGEFVKGYQGLAHWKAKFLHTGRVFFLFWSKQVHERHFSVTLIVQLFLFNVPTEGISF